MPPIHNPSVDGHQNNIEPIPEEIDAVGKLIVDAAYTVHKNIGPELLEKVYEIICELKAIETVNPVWEAQVLSHLKLTNKRLGYLINFNIVNIGKGIKRFAN